MFSIMAKKHGKHYLAFLFFYTIANVNGFSYNRSVQHTSYFEQPTDGLEEYESSGAIPDFPSNCQNSYDCNKSDNNGECYQGICQCSRGWEGTFCDLDINECTLEQNLCSRELDPGAGICINTPGSFYCQPNVNQCRTDFDCINMFDDDSVVCIDGYCVSPLPTQCRSNTQCNNGLCQEGSCVCFQGWTGTVCDQDHNGCSDWCCFRDVPCYDVAAPGWGFTCGPCPRGYTGDGINCTALPSTSTTSTTTTTTTSATTKPSTTPTTTTPTTPTTPTTTEMTTSSSTTTTTSQPQCDGSICKNGQCLNEECVCFSGWAGPFCDQDHNGCQDGCCFPGVECYDSPVGVPSEWGYTCGPCPDGYTGNGKTCSLVEPPTSTGCVNDSCEGRSDGDYSWCQGCKVYVTCSNERLHYQRCPEGLSWDGNNKRCEWWSSTCSSQGSCAWADCIYGSCSEGSNQCTCLPGWTGPRCDHVESSSGDNAESNVDGSGHGGQGPACISDSCDAIADGLYDWCDGCRGYISCVNGNIFYMPCPSGLMWDSAKQACDWSSPTCNQPTCQCIFGVCSNGNCQCLPGYGGSLCADKVIEEEIAPDVTEHFEPRDCIMSCEGMADGDYQLCHKCNHFAACSNEQLHEMPCALDDGGAMLVWDDTIRRCERASTTCVIDDSIGSCKCVNGLCSDDGTCSICLSGWEGDYCDQDTYGCNCDCCFIGVECEDVVAPGTGYACGDCPAGYEGDGKTCSLVIQDTATVLVEHEENVTNNPTSAAMEHFEQRDCIMSCEGMVDGDYQLCHKCNHFATCSNDQLHEMPCALDDDGAMLVWDDTIRRCDRASTTCNIDDIIDTCECVNGLCGDDGTCSICLSGWEGDYCDKDTYGCNCDCCFHGVECEDVVAPGTGYECGDCPAGYEGDGKTCSPVPIIDTEYDILHQETNSYTGAGEIPYHLTF